MARKRTGLIWKMSKEEFRRIVLEAKTFKEIFDKFGLMNKGNSHRTLKKRMLEEGVGGSHLQRKDVAMIRYNHKRMIPLRKVLVRGSSYCRCHLKKRLLGEGILKNVCEICGQEGIWNGKPLQMIIDHKNGASNDNRIENLRMVCPHCNSQLETFAGRNKKRNRMMSQERRWSDSVMAAQ